MEPACSALLFPFKATENLTICKEVNSHHKNIPTIAKVSSQVPHGVCCTTFYSEGVFSESAGLGSILSGKISFSQTASLIGKYCDISLGSVKREGGTCIKLAILLSRDVYSRNM